MILLALLQSIHTIFVALAYDITHYFNLARLTKASDRYTARETRHPDKMLASMGKGTNWTVYQRQFSVLHLCYSSNSKGFWHR